MLSYDNMLPIGTVVSLTKDPKSKNIITGYAVRTKDKQFDYCSVLYPIGGMDSYSADRVFNAEDIDKVLFEGFTGETPRVFELTKTFVLSALEEKQKQEKEPSGSGTELV